MIPKLDCPIPSVEDHIQHLLDQQIELQSQDPVSEPCFYFVTATFLAVEETRNSQIPISPSVCFAHFERFYVRMLSLLMNKYRRSSLRYLQPLTYAYLDYPFTKRKKTYSNLSPFQKMKRNHRLSKAHPETTPHIHSVMLLHPNILDRFQTKIPQLEPLFQRLSPINQTIDVRQVSPTVSDLKQVMRYSSLLFQNPPRDLRESDLFILLPKARSESTYVKANWEKELAQKLIADRAFREDHKHGWKAENLPFCINNTIYNKDLERKTNA